MNDDNQFIDQDFISTADIFYRMVMAIAQQSIAQRLPELGEETLAALTTYRDDYHDYESTLRALGKDIGAPKCPSEVAEIINLMETEGFGIDSYEHEIEELIGNQLIRLFHRVGDGVVRLVPIYANRKFNGSARLGYCYLPDEGNLRVPIFVRRDDIAKFIEGTARPADDKQTDNPAAEAGRQLNSQTCRTSKRKSPQKRGRPRGSGSFAKDDEPLIDEMRQLLDEENANSLTNAAQFVVSKAKGGGEEESKIRRLVRRYKNKYG